MAETFPEQLSTLEADLWVPPLRDAIRDALLLAGAATADQIARSPVVAVIDGFVAVDLQLTGEIRMPAGLFQKLNPVPAARRLHAAWRVGRLRSALDGLAEDLLDRVDADLEAVPNVEELTSRQVVALITRAREMLKSLHAHEVLIGLLTDRGESRMTSASVALRVLAEARQDGVADADIKTRSPVVLALTAPRVAADTDLPPSAATPDIAQGGQRSSDAAILREALRLRARWVQELTGRAAWLLGVRLTAAGAIGQPGHVRSLSLDEVEAVTYRAVPVGALLSAVEEPPSRPLPACFQISDLGRPVVVRRSGEAGGGTGAGGGVGTGTVTYDTADPPPGSVLVTTTLKPGLAPLLPRLAGIVAETGSVLAHLAILARESRVATVVGYAGAAEDLLEGMRVTVDGDTGDVPSSKKRFRHEEGHMAGRRRHAGDGGDVLGGVARPVGVEPRHLLRAGLPRRRAGDGDGADPARASVGRRPTLARGGRRGRLRATRPAHPNRFEWLEPAPTPTGRIGCGPGGGSRPCALPRWACGHRSRCAGAR
ncbi:MAG: PEP-utilizing enzyme [Acidimicrobiales bacterium]